MLGRRSKLTFIFFTSGNFLRLFVFYCLYGLQRNMSGSEQSLAGSQQLAGKRKRGTAMQPFKWKRTTSSASSLGLLPERTCKNSSSLISPLPSSSIECFNVHSNMTIVGPRVSFCEDFAAWARDDCWVVEMDFIDHTLP